MTLPAEVDLLIVDDDPAEVELLRYAFESAQPACRIGVARDGEEALDYILGRGEFRDRRGTALPRLVLLDFKLTRLDGLDVLRAIRSSPRCGAVPVVMLTSSADPRLVVQCYSLGANGCVEKPVVAGEFRSLIRDLARYWLGINRSVRAAASHS